jgi:outer membrane protein assembly factor BamB
MSKLPVPVRWTAPIEWPCYLWDPPLIAGDDVVVRAGGKIAAFAIADGTPRWSTDLQIPDQGGDVFGVAGGFFYCDAVRESDRTRILIGVTRNGVRWRTPLEGMIVRNGSVATGNEILAIATNREGSSLCRIDAKNGNLARTRLPAGGATIIRAGNETIVLSPTANADAPGAYVLADVGGVARVLRTNNVWYGAAAAGRLLTVGARQREHHTVDVRDIATGSVQWTDTCFNAAAALDETDAAYVVRGGSHELVLRDAASGTVRWRADLGDAEPATIELVDGLVLVRHMLGVVFVRRDTGQVLDDVAGTASFGAARAGDGFAMCLGQDVLFAELPR